MEATRDLLTVISYALCFGVFAALLVGFNHLHKIWQADQLDKAILRAISEGKYRNSYRYRPRKAKS